MNWKNYSFLVFLCLFSNFLFSQSVSSGNALLFDGVNDYVSIGSGSGLNFSGSDNFTIEAWINPQSNQQGTIFDKTPDVTRSNELSIWLSVSNGTMDFYLGQADKGWDGNSCSIGRSNKEWVHIAAVKEGNESRLYVNGILQSTTQLLAANDASASSTSAQLGAVRREGGTNFYKGLMDEVRIWNIALSASQISANKSKSISSGAGLVAAYSFNGAGDSGNMVNFDGNARVVSLAFSIPVLSDPSLITDNGFMVNWNTDNFLSAPTQFELLLADNSNFTNAKTIAVEDASQYGISDLKPSTAYFMKLRALDANQLGFYTEVKEVSTTAKLPDNNIVIENFSAFSIPVSGVWDLSVKEFVSSEIKQFVSDELPAGIEIVGATLKISKLDPGTYNFKIRAFNNSSHLIGLSTFNYVVPALEILGVNKKVMQNTSYPIKLSSLNSGLDKVTWTIQGKEYSGNKTNYTPIKVGQEIIQTSVELNGHTFVQSFPFTVLLNPVIKLKTPEEAIFQDVAYQFQVSNNFLNEIGVKPENIVWYLNNNYQSKGAIVSLSFKEALESKVTAKVIFSSGAYFKNWTTTVHPKPGIEIDAIEGVAGEKVSVPFVVSNIPSNSSLTASVYNSSMGLQVVGKNVEGTLGALKSKERTSLHLTSPNGKVVAEKRINISVLPNVEVRFPDKLFQSKSEVFYGSSSLEIKDWQWKIEGRGQTLTSSRQNGKFTFTKAGEYNLELVLTSYQGLKNKLDTTFTVFQNPEYSITNKIPEKIDLGIETVVDYDVNNGSIGKNEFFISQNPSGVLFDKSSGVFKWTPLQSGEISFEVVSKGYEQKRSGSKYKWIEKYSASIWETVEVVDNRTSTELKIVDDNNVPLENVRCKVYGKIRNEQGELVDYLWYDLLSNAQGVCQLNSISEIHLNASIEYKYLLSKDGDEQEILLIYNGESTQSLQLKKKEVFVGGLKFFASAITYNSIADEYTLTDAVVNDILEISGVSILSNSKTNKPLLKTNGTLKVINGETFISGGQKEFVLGLGMLIPNNNDSYFDLGSCLDISMFGAVLSFEGETVESAAFGKFPWIIGTYMNFQAEKFRINSVAMVTGGAGYLDFGALISSYGEYSDAINQQKDDKDKPKDTSTSSTGSKKKSQKMKSMYSGMQNSFSFPDIEITKVYSGTSSFWDWSVQNLSITAPSGIGLEDFDLMINSSTDTYECNAEIIWGSDDTRFRNENDSTICADSLSAFLEDLELELNNDPELKTVPVEFVDNQGTVIYQTSYDEYVDISDQIIYDVEERGLPISGIRIEIRIIKGKLDKIVISVDTEIPLGPIPLIISKITGGVDNITTDTMTVLLNCNMMDKAKTGLFEVTNLGLEIKPFSFFEGSGTVELVGMEVGYGRITYDNNMGLFSAYLAQSGFGGFFEGVTAFSVGNDAGGKFDMIGYGSYNVKTPGYSFIPSIFRNQSIGFAEAGISTHKVGAKVSLGSAANQNSTRNEQIIVSSFGGEERICWPSCIYKKAKKLAAAAKRKATALAEAAAREATRVAEAAARAAAEAVEAAAREAARVAEIAAREAARAAEAAAKAAADAAAAVAQAAIEAAEAAAQALLDTSAYIGGKLVQLTEALMEWINFEIGIGYDFDNKEFLFGKDVVVPTVTRRTNRGSTLIEDIVIAEDARKLYIFVDNNGLDSIDFSLLNPDGLNPGEGAIKAYYPEQKMMVGVVDYPAMGTWSIEVDTAKIGNVNIQTMYTNNTPSGQFLAPLGIDTSRTQLLMRFNDTNDTLDVAIFYDTDKKRFDGKKIADLKVVNNASIKFNYQPEGLMPGTYYFYYIIKDRSEIPIMQYSKGGLFVEGGDLDKPENLKYSLSNKSLMAYWNHNSSDDIQYTSLRLTDIITNEVFSKDIPAKDSLVYFRNLINGHKYNLSALNVGDNGFSKLSTIQNIIVHNENANNTPVWEGAPYKELVFQEGHKMAYGLNIVDPDGDNITLSLLENMPKNMAISGDSIVWLPQVGERGFLRFHAVASDGVNSDTINLQMNVLPYSHRMVEISFPSNNLYEADNMFVSIKDETNYADELSVFLINLRTEEAITIVADKVESGEYIGNFQLSYTHRTILPVSDGDTIVAMYLKNEKLYSTHAFFESTPQIADQIAPDQINDLQIVEQTDDSIKLAFTVPQDRMDNGIFTDPFVYDLRYNYKSLNSEGEYFVSQKIESYKVGKPGEKDTIQLSTAELYDFDQHHLIWFGLKAGDSRFNFSELSNSVNMNYISEPQNVQAQVDSLFQVSVTWQGTEATDADTTFSHYNLYRSNNTGGFEFIGSSATTNYVDQPSAEVEDGILNYAIEGVYSTSVTNSAFSNDVLYDQYSNVTIQVIDSLIGGIENCVVELSPVVFEFEHRKDTTNEKGNAIVYKTINSRYRLQVFKQGLLLVEDDIEVSSTENFFTYYITFDETNGNAAPLAPELKGLYVYPNPSNGWLRVALGSDRGVVYQYSIFDVNGKEVMNHNFDSGNQIIDINMESLVNGEYLLQLQGSQGIITHKVILAK